MVERFAFILMRWKSSFSVTIFVLDICVIWKLQLLFQQIDVSFC